MRSTARMIAVLTLTLSAACTSSPVAVDVAPVMADAPSGNQTTMGSGASTAEPPSIPEG